MGACRTEVFSTTACWFGHVFSGGESLAVLLTMKNASARCLSALNRRQEDRGAGDLIPTAAEIGALDASRVEIALEVNGNDSLKLDPGAMADVRQLIWLHSTPLACAWALVPQGSSLAFSSAGNLRPQHRLNSTVLRP